MTTVDETRKIQNLIKTIEDLGWRVDTSGAYVTLCPGPRLQREFGFSASAVFHQSTLEEARAWAGGFAAANTYKGLTDLGVIRKNKKGRK